MLARRRKLMANNVCSALATLLNTGVTFSAPLRGTVIPQTGYGAASFTRATTATVDDWEQSIKRVLSGEVRFQGARRVRNLLSDTQGFGAS